MLLPFYVAMLGAESYGIIGLGIALQSWLALLDLGLSGTLSREAARFVAGRVDAAELLQIWRLVRRVFIGGGLLVAALLLMFAGPIADQWLRNEALPDGEVSSALRLLGVVLALRLVVVPYRAFLTGLEDLPWIAGTTVAVTILRSVLVLPVMAAGTADLRTFFGWQLLVGCGEWAVYAIRTRRCLPRHGPSRSDGAALLHRHWRFSLGLAVTAAAWTAVTNLDRLILSGLLSLTDYGRFSLAVTAASGVIMLTTPIATAFGPRLIATYARGDRTEIARLYGLQTELVAVMAVAPALVLGLFAPQVLLAWTGDPVIAVTAAPVLALYALGNALMALIALPAMLQVAAGRLRLHVIGIACFVPVYLPLLALGLKQYGMAGAGLAWIVPNLLYVGLFVPLIHRRYLPEPHRRWLGRLALTMLPPAAAALALALALPWPQDRWWILAELVVVGGVLLAIAVGSAPGLRGRLLAWRLGPADVAGETA